MATTGFAPESAPEIHPSDAESLAAEIRKHQEKPEAKELTGPEIVKESLRSYTGSAAPGQPAGDDSLLPAYAQNAPAGTKLEVEHLVLLAFQEGILKANAAAAKSNPYVLDAFHDALAGKLYPELKKRGLVK